MAALRPGPNDRQTFDPAKVTTLATSIAEVGLLEPILVRPDGDGYEIVAGERRYRAVRQLGWAEVTCRVDDMDDQLASARMLAENVHRDDLNPMEEAEAYASRMSRFGLDVAQVATMAGVAAFRVKWRLDLLALGTVAREMVRSGALSPGFARAMVGLNGDYQHLALKRLADAKTPPNAEEWSDACEELRAEQNRLGLFDGDLLVNENYKIPGRRPRKVGKAGLVDLLRKVAPHVADEKLAAEVAAVLASVA